jgi:murein DD-endopeptidase MepM/ murein hydrolase activator NlpD
MTIISKKPDFLQIDIRVKIPRMSYLPPILEMTKPRPGTDAGKDKHLVPNEEYNEFWEAFYGVLGTHFSFSEPVLNFREKINPFFGNFGFRFHPVKKEPNYYHLGIDVSDKSKTPIKPILDGMLEYSGFGLVNGNYVFLSHPEVTTEDGFKLFSIYMHLKNANVKFSSYQKMLRQISFNHYPNISISKDTILGGMGSSGNSEGKHVHLHLQIEFRDEKGRIIVLDPASVLGIPPKENLSAKIKDEEGFEGFLRENEGAIKKMGIFY